MENKFSSHKTCIFGIQGSGKTHWAKKMYRHFKKPIVFAINDEGWQKLKGLYVYKADRYKDVDKEFDLFITKARAWADEGKIDLIMIDEADMFFQNNWHLNKAFLDLTLNHRHMNNDKGVALWFMTRRPQDIPTKIVEQSRHLVIFKLEGVNALKRFDEIHPDLRPMISKLNYHEHDFVYKELGEKPVRHKPLTK